MSQPYFLPLLFLDLAFVAGLTMLGWLTTRLADPRGSKLFAAALAFPLGSGLLTLAAFLLSLMGAPLTRGTILLCLGCGLLVLGLANGGRRRSPAETSSPGDRHRRGPKALQVLPLLAIVLLSALSSVISLGRSYSTWDAAAIWGSKGYGIAYEGTVWAASRWGAYGLSYPLNIPLQIASFAMLDGDIVPGAKLIFPLFYVSLALGLVAHFRSERSILGPWTAVFIAATPIVFDHATQGYANLPFATYIVLGILLVIDATASGRRGAFALSGLALGLAIWTRPEGLLLVVALYAAILVGGRLGGSALKPGWAWFLPALLIGGSWLAFSMANGEPGALSGRVEPALSALTAGELNLGAFYWIGRYLLRDLLRPSVWGLLLPTIVIGIVLHLRARHTRRRPSDWIVLSAAVAIGSFFLAFYYLISFSGSLQWWLDTGLSRMLLPAALLAAIWAVSPWVGAPRPATPSQAPEG